MWKENKFHWLSKIPKIPIIGIVAIVGCLGMYPGVAWGGNAFSSAKGAVADKDSVDWNKQRLDSIARKSVGKKIILPGRKMKTFVKNDSLDMDFLLQSPYISVQQLLKGNVSGVYVQENNGEPGSLQSMLIRGLSAPVFSNRDLTAVQPMVYLNGIPLAMENPYVYDVQQYSLNPIGNATNILANIDLSNIESIEVIKDPLELAKLGPLAANGAIWIETHRGYQGKEHIHAGASAGVVMPPMNIDPTNATYERNFRQRFYDAYGIQNPGQYYPAYLQDQTNPAYFGDSDWADSYYRYAPQYAVNASLGGGNAMSNYLFTVGHTKNAGVADKTGYAKYNLGFYINMVPVKGLTMTCMLNGNMAERDRNRNLTERYADVEYLPALSAPLAVCNGTYDAYLDKYGKGQDQNKNNVLNGFLAINMVKKGFYLDANVQLDYNTNSRHVFWPSTLMESVSYVSDYSGFNRRIIGDGHLGYRMNRNENHLLDVQLQGSVQADLHHYNYTRAFDGDTDQDKTTTTGNYILYRYTDRVLTKLVSASLNVSYAYKDLVNVGLVMRTDGVSNVQQDHRWLFSPAVNVGWNLKNHFLKESAVISGLQLGLSWAKMGRMPESDRFSLGPQYTSEDLNWSGQSVISSVNGFPSITRSYGFGWIGYDLGWQIAEKRNAELRSSFFRRRLEVALSFYDNYDRDMIVRTPTVQEFGYEYQLRNGMEINNRGVELGVSGVIVDRPGGFRWEAALQMAYNRNELKKLPGGLTETVIGDRMLKVGEAVDRFWVYENQGTYGVDAEVPVKDGMPLSINGIAFQHGDPVWTDRNGDQVITSRDKVLKGHATPPFTGGLTSRLSYKKFDLGFQLFFATGHSALDYRSSQRYDFATLDTRKFLDAIREVYFWQSTNDKNDYPLYNPLSEVHPYRADQDLFLEKLAYLKLRSVSLGYTFSVLKKQKKEEHTDNLYVYVTGNNLFTISNFSGDDPELVGFDGYYRGTYQPIPRSVTAGVRFKF